MEAAGRLLAELNRNKTFAQRIASNGALGLAMEYLKSNGEECAVAASKMIADITSSCPEKAEEMLLSRLALQITVETAEVDYALDPDSSQQENALNTICKSLETWHKNAEIATALSQCINRLCDLGFQFKEGLAHNGGPHFLLSRY